MNVAVVVYSFYPSDPRVRRETEALVQAGYQVRVICLKETEDEATREDVRGADVYRIPIERRRGSRSRYIWEYALFIFLAAFKLAWMRLRWRIDLVHVHSMPDILVFVGLVPRLLGARVILDLHDPMPEVFIAKYHLAPTHRIISLLRFFEKISAWFAHTVLTPNKAFRNLFVSRSCPAEKIHVIMNSPQENIFLVEPPPAENREEPPPPGFRIMFHGSIVKRHGLDSALEVMTMLRSEIPGLRFDLFGVGDYVEAMLALIEEKSLGDVATFHGVVTLEEIAAAIRKTDLGLIPNDRSPFTEINMPTRIFEYLCLGKPVIVPSTQGIRDYFTNDNIYFFEPGNPENLRDTILRVYRNPEERKRMVQKGQEVYRRHTWEMESAKFINVVENLLSTTRQGRKAAERGR